MQKWCMVDERDNKDNKSIQFKIKCTKKTVMSNTQATK